MKSESGCPLYLLRRHLWSPRPRQCSLGPTGGTSGWWHYILESGGLWVAEEGVNLLSDPPCSHPTEDLVWALVLWYVCWWAQMWHAVGASATSTLSAIKRFLMAHAWKQKGLPRVNGGSCTGCGFPRPWSCVVPKGTPGMEWNLPTLIRSAELGTQQLVFLYSQRTSTVISNDTLSA